MAPKRLPEALPAPRRLAALDAKLASLKAESAAWLADSVDDKSRFALHHSQLGEICATLEAMHDLIRDELAALRKAGAIGVPAVERLERRILAALQIWESYRSKFALRVQQDLRDSLRLIDELAWQAYTPAHDAAEASGRLPPGRRRLPPLVFTNTRWSPFARSREQAYELDESTGVLRNIDDFDRYLRAIPVPLIGIPWYQASHLPDAVFVGHEVGHIVEEDLGLDAELRGALLAAIEPKDAQRAEVWSRRWRSETFADVWGVLATGPAFVQTLIEQLRGAPDIATETQPDRMGRWSDYPPRWLRVRLACAALRRLPDAAGQAGAFKAEADTLERAWDQAYPEHRMEEFAADVDTVIDVLMASPLEAFAAAPGAAGRPLTQVLSFTRAMQDAALLDAANVRESRDPVAKDLRTCFAAIALAFIDDPQGYAAADVHGRFRTHLLALQTQRVRAAGDGALPAPAAADRLATARSLLAWVDAAPAPRRARAGVARGRGSAA
jgi:hypothetical protein